MFKNLRYRALVKKKACDRQALVTNILTLSFFQSLFALISTANNTQ